MSGKRTLREVREVASGSGGEPIVSFLILLAIVGFLISPFAVSGYRRKWRAAAAVFAILAICTAAVWLRPLPPSFDDQDQMGAETWQMILLVLTIASAFAFTSGLAVSALASKQRNAP